MVDVSTNIGPVVEAFISGLIGVGTVESRNRRQGKENLRGWYDGTTRLAERVERAHIAEQYTGDRGRYVRVTFAGVHTKLISHVSEAPDGIEEGVLEVAEGLISDCQQVKILDERRAASKPAQVMKRMEPTLDSATTLITEVNDAKERV